eukprot:CAMPEP_0113647522 /NCGR_PEP_ID=MMETSP0017_2-20120614/25163_1 /TAXON_ID=2856 /ORGANISM="Cylindrotheca closterium" /LENGTH=342 /DNA_ID=CAMNT_0000559599 /DNA_START=65 /DNA_END=1089 /DNA_ORIENTATION=+ /assembly_acc=CAM_ASM_000147
MNDDHEEDNEDVSLFQQRPLLQLEDEEEWLRRNGLMDQSHFGDASEYNQSEARRRVQDQANYQKEVHNKLFEKEQQEDQSLEQNRQNRLNDWKEERIVLVAADMQEDPISVNLAMLASHSDTVFTMAESRAHYGSSALSVSLPDYSSKAVQAFLDMLSETYLSAEESTILYDHIIDACRLAHYLQCNELLEKIVKILIPEIDSANCLSLCQLADQLALPSLMEASLGFVMKRLTSLETHEVWNELGSELQDQIQAIQAILKSNNRRDLFFSSFTEYVAVFAEQVQYYKERLVDARMQQEQHDQNSPAWAYTQDKINRQAERVETLKIMLAEQKRIFLPRPDG